MLSSFILVGKMVKLAIVNKYIFFLEVTQYVIVLTKSLSPQLI